MNEVVSSSKFTIFDLVVYLIPGLILVLYVAYTIPGFPSLNNPPGIVTSLVSAFVAGNILHQFAPVPEAFLWGIYHMLKERDSDGHGVTNPKYPWGKFAKWFRYNLLEFKQSLELKQNATKLIAKDFAVDSKNALDIYYCKEVLFNIDPEARSGFLYLHYQSLFSKSMAFLLFLLSALTIAHILIGDFAIYSKGIKIFDFEGFGIAMSLASIFLVPIFVKRYKFFDGFRKQVVNAYVINFYNNQTK